MFVAETTIRTALGSRYLQQLCKHFAHKITVQYDKTDGRADFGFGTCVMAAAENSLTLRCEADTRELLGRVHYIVDDHVRRFTWREKPAIDWSLPPEADQP